MSKEIVIRISTENDAFVDNEIGETVRILRFLADKFENNGLQDYGLRDINGNLVGTATVNREQ